jgi:hypothetical protein
VITFPNSFAQGSYFLRAIKLKNYSNVLWIFSFISFVGKNNWKND